MTAKRYPPNYFDQYAVEYQEIKKELLSSKDLTTKEKFYLKGRQNQIIGVLKHLVHYNAKRYQIFSNGEDITQEGFEGLLQALETYEDGKSAFSWWASKYIKARIARSASSNSLIRIPIDKSKEHQISLTELVDFNCRQNLAQPSPENSCWLEPDAAANPEARALFKEQNIIVTMAVEDLSAPDKFVLNSFFGIDSAEKMDPESLSQILKTSQSNIKTRIKNIRKDIRKSIQKIEYHRPNNN